MVLAFLSVPASCHAAFSRLALFLSLALGGTIARADERLYPAPEAIAGHAPGREILIYSSLDVELAEPLILAFQRRNGSVAIRYDELLTGEVHDRIRAETLAGERTADLAISSAMDLQVRLANDGFAMAVDLPVAEDWPRWANWRDTAFALTVEPAVIVYYRPAFPEGPPLTRGALTRWLETAPSPRIGTYDIARAAVGYLFLSRDQAHFADIWNLVGAMGAAGVQIYPTSREIIEAVASGELLIGYNILGSYAQERATDLPDLGIALPRDFVVAVGRVALVPRAAGHPEGGTDFLEFLMGIEGQVILGRDLHLTAVSPAVSGPGSAAELEAAAGDRLRPVPVGPGLLAYVDQSRRRLFLGEWAEALGLPVTD